jgi:hypothetical protein
VTLPGPVPRRATTSVERIADLERRIRAMQSAPKLAATRDSLLFGDTLSTAPRASIQGAGSTLSLNVPRGVLLVASVPTSPVSRVSFAVQNTSVSAATIGAAVYIGTDPTALTPWGSGSTAITASVGDVYDVILNNGGTLPVGYVLVLAQATAVGATVPSLSITGQAPVDVHLGNDINAGPIFTNVVGATTMTPWPSTLSMVASNTAVWTASQSTVWFALG